MPTEQVVDLRRMTLQEVLILGGPILALAVTVSLAVNIVQVLTSLQETTISTVPRLLAIGTAVFLMMPWMWRQMCHFTLQLLSDFHPYIR